MFGTKKEIAALRECVERSDAERRQQEREREEKLLDRIAALEEKISGDGKNTDLEVLGEKINRHDLAIGDLVDSMEEMMTEQRERQEALSDALGERAEREAKEAKRREEKLLALAIACEEQLFALKTAATVSEDDAWQRQIESAEEKILSTAVPAGFQRIDRAGEAFSYDLHEAIETRETEDSGKAMKVAEVYTCGAMYQGKVMRKAKVAVYQIREEELE